MNISRETCAKIYHDILANAESHRRCANILAKENEYPNSVAHLILGTEELLKGFVMLLESRGMNLRQIDGFKKIFNDHKSRHYILRDLIPIWIVIKKIADEFEEPTAITRLKPGAPKWMQWVIGALSVAHEGMNGYMQYQFWKEADQLKQKAFYVDYEDTLCLPSEITKDFHSLVERKVDRVTREVKEFIEELEKATPAENAEFMQRALDEDFRELLAKTISGKHSIFTP
jgi:AbiV family abortive infection protein